MMKMNLPNTLTLFRLFLIPVFILTFFSEIPNSFVYSVIIFLIAGVTDVLDGFIARKYNLITKWGILFDPFADKLMLITVLTCLVIYGYIPLWVLIIIAVKESIMISGGIVLFSHGTVIPSNLLGKITTFLFYAAVFTLTINVSLGRYLMYFAVGSAAITSLNYLILFVRSKAA